MRDFEEKNYKIIGQNVRKLRKKLGISQEKFAEMLEVERETINKIENAYKKDHPGLKILMKIAYNAKIELHELFMP